MPSIGDLALVGSARVDRTHSDFSYRVQLSNPGDEIRDVFASVTSTASATEIIDGEVEFGDVPAGATVTSLDTFTLRQDRRVPFDPESLVWRIEFGEVLPPDTTPPRLTLTAPAKAL